MRVLFIIRGLEAAEPLGAMYIAAVLRRGGHEVKFLSTRGVDLLTEAAAFAPGVIAYSVCTGQQGYYLSLNRWLKKHLSFVSVFGGPHATFFPDMIEEHGVDVVCRGEGEYAALDLCDALGRGGDIGGIPNLWTKRNGPVSRNAPRPLIADLDSLPFPDRDVRWSADPHAREYAAHSFLTGRGCPYRCAYCFNPSMQQLYGADWSKRRIRSPANVVAEIEQVKATSALSFVQFRCSMFPDDPEWLREFAELYRAKIGLPFYCHVRADHMSNQVVALMAAAGCKSVNMGIECADEAYRRDVLLRPMSNDVIRAACRRLHEHGIAILSDNIVGLPGRTLDDDIQTMLLNAECGVDYPLAMILQPYPGTAIDRYAQDNGWFDGDYSQIDFNYYLHSPLRFPRPDEKQQIENFQKLFAIGAAIPSLLPILRRLARLPANLVFNSIFRCWFIYCYHTRIMPHRLSWRDVREIAASIFGIYKREAFHDDAAETAHGAGDGGRAGGGAGRGAVPGVGAGDRGR